MTIGIEVGSYRYTPTQSPCTRRRPLRGSGMPLATGYGYYGSMPLAIRYGYYGSMPLTSLYGHTPCMPLAIRYGYTPCMPRRTLRLEPYMPYGWSPMALPTRYGALYAIGKELRLYALGYYA